MLRKVVCLILIIVFSSSLLFAQATTQVGKTKELMEFSRYGKSFNPDEVQDILGQYKEETSKTGSEDKAEEDGLQGHGVVEREPDTLSELEEMLTPERFVTGEALRQYGYDVFKSAVASFIPSEDTPVGPGYIVGPGDIFNVTLWGITEGIFKVEVNREGDIVLPKIGVVKVAGLSYADLKPFIEQQLGRYYESVNVGITIDELRTIRVYVVGEVNQPGSYSISSLSTAYGALFAAGGPSKMGSLRNIEVRRGDRIIAKIDLYRFLLKGDKSQDRTLQSGDTIFVPIIGPVVGIAGTVKRPAIYEIKGQADLADLIYLAGGFRPSSYLNRVQVKRIEAHKRNVVRDENITAARASKNFGFLLQDMDLVEVFPIYQAVDNVVYLEGEVKYPGSYEFMAGMRVKDILPGPKATTIDSFLPHAELIRTDKESREIEIISLDLEGLFKGDELKNIELQSGDRIQVSSKLKEQKKVVLSGEVQRPGTYTIGCGERLASVLKRAGGYSDKAYIYGAKFVRKSVMDLQGRHVTQALSKLQEDILRRERDLVSGKYGPNETALLGSQLDKSGKLLDLMRQQVPIGRIVVNLGYPLEEFAESEHNIVLEDGDSLYIPPVPDVVNIIGEVFNPTALVYRPDQELKGYLKQVGGMTKHANKGGVYIIRADGSVLSKGQRYNIVSMKLFPGDTVVVPLQIETFSFLAAFKDWVHLLYESAATYALVVAILN
ncbi:SLBB domain-containing protein [Candidatus Margulisiibacteriota bacterium]